MSKSRTDPELWDALEKLDDDVLNTDFPISVLQDELREIGVDALALAKRGAEFVTGLQGDRHAHRGGPVIAFTLTERSTLARLEAQEEATASARARRQAANREAEEHGRAMVLTAVTRAILARWRAAGYTSARLVEGLPQPEPSHAAEWLPGWGYYRTCACGATVPASRANGKCPGRSGYDLVWQALADGVRFELVDGLPVARRMA